MIKKVLDTNIYIDLFVNPDSHKDFFISEGPIYLSSIVFMELLAGAHTKNEKKQIQSFINLFKKLGRILIPTVKDYEQAGEILIRLQNIKGYDIKKSASITNDCLIATTVRNIGGVLYTQNKKDFQAIQDVFDFKVPFVQREDS
jgi:predicted nucleic acid-binding protein